MPCLSRDKAKVSIEMDGDLYHEKQHKEMCALHALNNLFQEQVYTKSQLDDICLSLSPGYMINPHRSMLGTGNYDVNVIMSALQKKNCETIWFDKRKSVFDMRPEKIIGFILNIPTDYKWGILHLPMHRKHWITIRQINNTYYNLDSKLDSPENIGNTDELKCYLLEQMECKDKEMLVIVSKDVEEAGSWRGDDINRNRDQNHHCNGNIVSNHDSHSSHYVREDDSHSSQCVREDSNNLIFVRPEDQDDHDTLSSQLFHNDHNGDMKVNGKPTGLHKTCSSHDVSAENHDISNNSFGAVNS